MKQVTLLSIVAASVLFIGCGEEKASEAPKAAASAAPTHEIKAAPATTSTVEQVTQAVQAKATEVKEAVAQKAEEAKAVASNAVDATKAAASEAVEKTAEVAKEAQEAVAAKVEEAKAEVSTPTVNLAACAGCHGKDFEKKAMGVSKIVKDMSKADIETALKGYKDGTYGGNMKTLMKGQVGSFDDAKIKAIADQVGK